jgi:hypothetical protein
MSSTHQPETSNNSAKDSADSPDFGSSSWDTYTDQGSVNTANSSRAAQEGQSTEGSSYEQDEADFANMKASGLSKLEPHKEEPVEVSGLPPVLKKDVVTTDGEVRGMLNLDGGRKIQAAAPEGAWQH